MDIAPAIDELFAQSTGSIPTPGNVYFYGHFYCHMTFIEGASPFTLHFQCTKPEKGENHVRIFVQDEIKCLLWHYYG